MSKHFCKPRRIGLLDMDQPTEPVERTVQITVAVEGLFESLASLFKKKIEKLGDPETHLYNYTKPWGKEFANAISKTYGNISWVEENFHPNTSRNDTLPSHLAYKGKIEATPLLVLKKAEGILQDHFRHFGPVYARYNIQMNKIRNDVVALMRAGTNPEQIVQTALREARKVVLPFRKGLKGPEWFGGEVAVVDDLEIIVATKPPIKGVELPEITPRDVVDAAKFIVDYYKTPSPDAQFFDKHPSFELWELFESASYRDDLTEDQEELYHLFYFQNEPSIQQEFLMSYSFSMAELTTRIGRWLYLVTN